MKYLMSLILIAALFVGFTGITWSADAPKIDVAKMFVEKKCNSCHSVTALTIAKTNANSKAADLSLVGKTRTAEFLTKYLKKEADIDGKKHGVAFKGTDDEFSAMVTWLSNLK